MIEVIAEILFLVKIYYINRQKANCLILKNNCMPVLKINMDVILSMPVFPSQINS